MRMVLRAKTSVLVVCVVLINTAAYGTGTTSVYYKQTGSTPLENPAGGPTSTPAPMANIMGGSYTTDYVIDSSYELDALTLRSKASIDFSAMADEVDVWETMEARTTSNSVMSIWSRVQGVPNGTMGTLQFNFAIDGNTSFFLDDVDNVEITEF